MSFVFFYVLVFFLITYCLSESDSREDKEGNDDHYAYIED